MSAADILNDLCQHGATVTLDAGAVRIKAPKGCLPAALVEAARFAKPELVALLIEAAHADFEERAAIMEFDGRVRRAQAAAARASNHFIWKGTQNDHDRSRRAGCCPAAN